MIGTIVFNKIKSFILVFLNLFRRALCCFRRRRRNSCDTVPLTHVGVVSNDNTIQQSGAESWSDWDDDKPKTVQDHIEMYRKQAFTKVEEPTVEEEQNFFEDMAPKITKTSKIYVSKDNENVSSGSRLNFSGDNVTILPTSELTDWEENSGWEGDKLDWDTQEVLREKRRQERERRLWEQQQKRQEKMRSLGARIVS